MFGGREYFLIAFNDLNNFLSETLRHIINSLKNKLVPFLLENILLCNQVLDQLDNKLLLWNSVRWKDRRIVEVNSSADWHQDFHVLKICLDSGIWGNWLLLTGFKQLDNVLLENSVQIILVSDQWKRLDSLKDLLAVGLLKIQRCCEVFNQTFRDLGLVLISVQVLAKPFQTNRDMVQSWLVHLVDLIVDKFQNRLVICSFVDSSSEHFETVPNDLCNVEVSLLPHFRDCGLIGDIFDLTQDRHKVCAKNFHVFLTIVFFQRT